MRRLKQNDLPVEDYATKFRSVQNRMSPIERPMDKTMSHWFIRGLQSKLKSLVASLNVEDTGFDGMVEAAKRSEEEILDKNKSKRKTKKKVESDSESDEDESESNEESKEEESDEDEKPKARKKKKEKKGDKNVTMEDLMWLQWQGSMQEVC